MIPVVPFDSGININTDQESVVKLIINPAIVNLNNVSVAAVEETTILTNPDRFFLWDSGWYSITWQNIVVRLKAYFDTIYSTFSGVHNDTTNRDAANSHPATAITFTVEEIQGTKTIQPADSSKHFYSTAAADIDVTIDSGLTHPISIFQKGAGVVTIIAGTGTPTLLGDVKTAGQNKAIAVVPETTAIYEIIGGVA